MLKRVIPKTSVRHGGTLGWCQDASSEHNIHASTPPLKQVSLTIYMMEKENYDDKLKKKYSARLFRNLSGLK